MRDLKAKGFDCKKGVKMNTLIVYGSQYGSTKRYAERFAAITHLPILPYAEVKSIAEYQRIVYFGGLYAGGVKGLKTTAKKLSQQTELIIVTVGISDPNSEENVTKIEESVKKQVPEQILLNTSFFHLRGAIDYSRLNFIHRMMMKVVYNSIRNRPAENISEEDKLFLETYGKKIDFVNYDSLKPIIEAIK